MKNVLLVLGSIAIVILLLLLYFNKREANEELRKQRQQYEDSLQRHDNVQAILRIQLDSAEDARDSQRKKDSVSTIHYIRENARLYMELRKASTPRVEHLVAVEPELRRYILYYDSALDLKDLRVDSLQLSLRIEKEMSALVDGRTYSLLKAKDNENEFLKGEVDKRDATIKKLKRVNRRDRAIGALGWLLNLLPRG